MEESVTYNLLNDTHLKRLKKIVPEDRFYTGESNLELHSRDQSHHESCLPEVVLAIGVAN